MASGKTDMERVALFKEMSYLLGDKYRPAGSFQFHEAASKGKQMLPGGRKLMCNGTQAGYFADKFNRVMDGEAYSDPVKQRRQWRLDAAKKNIGKTFLPASGEKMQCGLGSYHGTFSGPIGAFSPANKPGQGGKRVSGRNFTTNPGKKGCGAGYMNITLGPYHKYMSEPFGRARDLNKKDLEAHKGMLKGGSFKLNMHPTEFFDGNPYRTDKPLPQKRSSGGDGKRLDLKPFKPSSPAKKPGGNKSGCFDPYPSHSNDPYVRKGKRIVEVKNISGKIFIPNPDLKSAPCRSIINQNVVRSVNNLNYKTVRSVTCIA